MDSNSKSPTKDSSLTGSVSTSESDGENAPMFIIHEEWDCFVHELTNPSGGEWNKRQRREVSQHVPSLLCEPRNLTYRELDAIGWTQVNRKPHVIECEVEEGRTVRYPFLRFFDEEEIAEGGAWAKFKHMQSIAASADFQERLRKVSQKKTDTHELSFSVQPGNNRKKCIGLSRTGKTDDDEFAELRELVAECAGSMVKVAFAQSCPEFGNMIRRRWCLDGSLTVGCEDNFAVSGLQMNFTSLDNIESEKGKSEGLGDFGGLHMDGNDDPGRVTVILNLSHLPKSYYPGRFNITTACITVTAAPFTAIVFRGTHPHFATGFGPYKTNLPLDSPLRYSPPKGIELPVLPAGTPYTRIVQVAYPKEVLMRPRIRFMRNELYTEKAVDTFGTIRAQQEWRMRMYLNGEFDNLPEDVTPELVCESFKFINEVGEEDQPRQWIADCIFDWHNAEDMEWEDANAAAMTCSIGKKFVNPRTRGLTKSATEVWTDLGLNIAFDPTRDYIPANVSWKPQPAADTAAKQKKRRPLPSSPENSAKKLKSKRSA